jgi:CHAD domain-containing protein
MSRKQKVDLSIRVFGAGVLLQHLQALQQEVEGVRQAQDIEYIHRMRVASRRLRNALALFAAALPARKLARWTRQVRAVTRALGEARDTDVQLDRLNKFDRSLLDPLCHPGIRRLRLRLSQRRARLQENVQAALAGFEKSAAATEMTAELTPLAARQPGIYLYTPALYQAAFDAVSSRLADFLSYREAIKDPAHITELHAMRIAAKHLRYTLETYAPLYQDALAKTIQGMRKVQDSLGEIHDCDVWAQVLPQFSEEERRRTLKYLGNLRPMRRLERGLAFFLADRQNKRNEEYTAFMAYWNMLEARQVWEILGQVIRAPVDVQRMVDESTPPALPEIPVPEPIELTDLPDE